MLTGFQEQGKIIIVCIQKENPRRRSPKNLNEGVYTEERGRCFLLPLYLYPPFWGSPWKPKEKNLGPFEI